MASKNETMADIIAEMRERAEAMQTHGTTHGVKLAVLEFSDRIEAAWKRERKLLRSCARWILTNDIYGHMAQELLDECKEVLGDDGKFLMPKGDMV